MNRLALELGIDYREILRTSHGRRSIDVLLHLDPSKANWECKYRGNLADIILSNFHAADVSAMEAHIPTLCSSPAVEIPGARLLLESLDRYHVPHAVVTSGTKVLLDGWLKVLQLPRPQDVIVAEDVKAGKPDPEGYIRARERLSRCHAAPGQVLVMEDAPAGIHAGKAAGCSVLAVATTHTVEQLKAAGADWVVRDHRSVQIWNRTSSGEFRFKLNDLLWPH
jgi:glycerol 3-phosphatase-1